MLSQDLSKGLIIRRSLARHLHKGNEEGDLNEELRNYLKGGELPGLSLSRGSPR
jgi:hypothetical protein